MLARFCTYAVLRNLRFFDPFFLLFLLHDVGVDFITAGTLLAFEKVLGGALEVPLGVLTDRYGRRRSLIGSFTLAAVAFVIFGVAAHGIWTLPLLYLGQTVYAVAEAARSGSHKAIILDWLTREGRPKEKAQILGVTRFFSKSSAGIAALAAGLIVWRSGSFTWLFYLAIVPTLLAAGLLWTYPRTLEGSLRQSRKAGVRLPGTWAGLKQAARRPGVLGMIAVSVLFESQIKLALVYLQPFLAERLAEVDLTVTAGIGALAYGGWFFLQGLAAGSASLFAPRLERRFGGSEAAIRRIHRWGAAALVSLALLGVFTDGMLGLAGLPLFAALAALQNARRPLFVSALDDHMDRHYRATTLSLESQLRGWAYAVSALVAGALADASNIGWALGWMGIALAVAVVLGGAQTTSLDAPVPGK